MGIDSGTSSTNPLFHIFNRRHSQVVRHRIANPTSPVRIWLPPPNQGLTETAIESVEPEESEQTLEAFFERFPEGTYNFSGTNADDETITGEDEFTHDLLKPVAFTKITLPLIEWIEPEEGIDNEPLDVVGYELVVELVVEIGVNGDEENGDTVERVFKETTTYPAGFNTHIVGNRFMKLIKNPPGEIVELKVEILADEPSGNRTITEEIVIEEEE